MLARRNGEHMRIITALRERDRQLAGESVQALVRRAAGGERPLVDVVVETRGELVGDWRFFQDTVVW